MKFSRFVIGLTMFLVSVVALSLLVLSSYRMGVLTEREAYQKAGK